MSRLVNILYGNEKNFKFYPSTDKNPGSTTTTFAQTSFPFGRDRQGGGSSNQPYIKNDILGKITNKVENITAGLIDLGPATRGLTDVVRLGEWFVLPPTHALKFTTKQVLLTQSGLNSQRKARGTFYTGAGNSTNSGKGFIGKFTNKIKNKVSDIKNATKGIVKTGVNALENDLNILKQAGTSGLGFHHTNPLLANQDNVKIEDDIFINDSALFNREKTYQEGEPGKKGLKRTDISKPVEGLNNSTVDKLQTTPISFYDSADVHADAVALDTVPFYISVLNNENSSKNQYIHFRAFMNNISDNFTANWLGHSLMGRGEQFFTYGGFNRDLTLSFKVHAQSKQEIDSMYTKLNYLASITAPDYGLEGGFMKGNIIKLTIGDYIYNVPGILKGVAFSLPMEGSWDIARNNDGTRNYKDRILPHLIEVSTFNFTPIHDFVPRKGAPFINNRGKGFKWEGAEIQREITPTNPYQYTGPAGSSSPTSEPMFSPIQTGEGQVSG